MLSLDAVKNETANIYPNGKISKAGFPVIK